MQSTKAGTLPSAMRHILIFAISASTLMTQVLLTRIFSATMLYHYAFAAISLTMLGMTSGAVIVLLNPERFGRGHEPGTYASLCAWDALALIVPTVLVSSVENFASPTITSLLTNLLAFFPAFLISGMLITLLLTRS